MLPESGSFRLMAVTGAAVLAVAATPLSVRAGDTITPFAEEAVSRGLIYTMQTYGSGPLLGIGMAIADLNSNGHQDIVLMGTGSGTVGFFENDGTGHFINRSVNQSIPKLTLGRPSGIALGDYNGDGLLDIYFTQDMNQNTGQLFPNFLMRNEGDFTFTNVTTAAGVGSMANSYGAAWGDFDNDGWLDLYLANYPVSSQSSNPQFWNLLFHNQGDGSFNEIGLAMGVADFGMTFTAVFTDMNRNGWLDLYIANDRGHLGLPPNQLWRNDEGTFTNLCPESGACVGLWAMCAAVGDVSGNGYPDFYVTNLQHPAGYNGWNPFLINHGDETFSEACPEAGVCNLASSWASIFFDFDNSGWLDLYVCNQAIPNRLFKNNGGIETFPMPNVAAAAGIGGSSGWSYSAAVGDVTGNGALDLLLNNYTKTNEPPANVQLFINYEGVKRSWMRFVVVGLPGSPNVHALGSNVEVTSGDHVQWREIYAGGNNYKAQNELVFHFGLGDANKADKVVVNWPGGQAQRILTNYPANKRWTIHPPQVLGDSNGDGVIGVSDLLVLLGAWGPVKPGSEIMDITGSGQIGVGDLLALLGKWGAM